MLLGKVVTGTGTKTKERVPPIGSLARHIPTKPAQLLSDLPNLLVNHTHNNCPEGGKSRKSSSAH